MRKSVVAVIGAVLLLFSLAVVAASQVQTTTVTKTKTVQNPDGTYSIVEYPVGKETIVSLNPVGITGAIGHATILRDDNGTTIKVNFSELPSDMAALNLYAVDPTGAVSALGPVEIANGVGTFTTTMPLTRFMLIASPEANLTAYDPNTKIFFRSDVPSGLAVIPIGSGVAVGEQVGATTVGEQVAGTTVVTDYSVPMLGIPHYKKGDETKLKINFTGSMDGARANIFITPHSHGRATEVLMHFHELKEAPKGQAFVLWAVSPDNRYQRLGQIVNVKGRNEAEIKSETEFDDFGLLLTSENLVGTTVQVVSPAGTRVGVIQLVP
jgi:hypothetical protein